MKKNISSKLVFIALLALFGCSSKKKLVAFHKPDSIARVIDTVAKQAIPHLSTEQLAAIQSKQLSFSTFSAKAKAKMNIDGANNDVTLNIRIKKGQEIWISVTALLGLEGARAVITPDSIKIINRLESTYTKKPFGYLYQYAGNQLNFETLENLVLGNAWPGTVNENAALQNTADSGLVLNGALGQLMYQLVMGADMRVSKTIMASHAPERSLQVVYNGSFPVGERTIPTQINISSAGPEAKIQVNLTYTKAEFDKPVDLPFSVPARYSVVN
jgi:hypothetical protein